MCFLITFQDHQTGTYGSPEPPDFFRGGAARARLTCEVAIVLALSDLEGSGLPNKERTSKYSTG